MVAQMYFASAGIHRQWRGGQGIMRTVHAPLGWGFLVLLDCHGIQLLDLFSMQVFQCRERSKKRPFPFRILTIRLDRTFTFPVTWGSWQTQDYFVLNQRDDVHVRGRQNTLDRFIFIKAGQLIFISCQQQMRAQIQRISVFTQAPLATEIQGPLNGYFQEGPGIHVERASNGVLQLAAPGRQIIL
jgi:hypothetical protein